MKVEDIENGLSSSPFTKSASDVDEKGQNYQRVGIGLSNQKKAVMTGYTSPTISASSKAIGHTKVILSKSMNNKTQRETGSGLDPNRCNEALSGRQSESLSHEDSGLNRSKESSVNDGLSTEQYDPLTNYLSPRPKFLRYRPTRSREIFLRQQNEVGEEIYSKTAIKDEQKVLFSPGSFSSEEISENEQEEEEDDEEEEEREEDGEEFEEDDEEFEEDKGCWTLKGVFKLLALLMAAVLYAIHLSSSNTDSMSSHSFRSNEILSNGTCSAQDCENEAKFATKLLWESDFLDPTHGRRKGWREEEINVNNFFPVEEICGGINDQTTEAAEMKDGEREVGGHEGGGKDGEDDLTEGEELEFEDPFHCKEPTETKIFENVIETNDDQNPFSVSTNSEIAADEELVKTDDPEKMAGGNSNFVNLIRLLRGGNYSEYRIIQNMNTRLFFHILISFSAFLIMLIVSVVFYRSKKKIAVEKQQCLRVEALELENENTLEKISPLTLKACSESVIVEENDSIISREGQPLDSIWLKEEKDISIARYYNSRAPTVELLGEFVVGGETENTLKNRMIESKDSNNLVSIEERSAYSRPALSELSNSPSYGSFTAEKIVKNEAGGGGDLKVISTPVRRSSRIKNRAAMSP